MSSSFLSSLSRGCARRGGGGGGGGNSSAMIRRGRRLASSSSKDAKPQTSAKMVAEEKSILIPTREQLKVVALRAAIPMVGFGAMDNFVMITAGDAIDSTFGVALGISTLTAAGFGQCCSDVAGITCGGIVDAAVAKMNLPVHRLSPEQLDLRITRMWSTFGACVGVLTGCLLGMSILLLMDTDKADRERRAKELQSIFESVMDEGHKLLSCQRATLFVLDEQKQELWSRVATGIEKTTKEEGPMIIKSSVNEGLVGACVTTGQVINVTNAYDDPRFNPDIDKRTGYKTKSVLCMPVRSDDGDIIGAIQMINKDENRNGGQFDDNDEKMMMMLSSHVNAFIRIVDSTE